MRNIISTWFFTKRKRKRSTVDKRINKENSISYFIRNANSTNSNPVCLVPVGLFVGSIFRKKSKNIFPERLVRVVIDDVTHKMCLQHKRNRIRILIEYNWGKFLRTIHLILKRNIIRINKNVMGI